MFFRKKRRWPQFFLLVLIILFSLVYLGYRGLKNLTPEKILQSSFVQQQVAGEDKELFNLLPQFLGFTKPMTYLVLFQNNTELRPGGGFIGVYGIIKMEQGKLKIIKLQGTENLDRETPVDWRPVPPQPLSDHLKIDRWYFRDSNWSPDFSVSAKKALQLYQGEGGVAADEIDAVIAFTPTVLEELLKITGPLTVQGLEFKADNVTEKLEYEVEYGYDDRGLAFHERKQIIQPFFNTLVNKLSGNIFNLPKYLKLLDQLALEKHILVYALDPKLQASLVDRGWTGQLQQTTGDYLLWVDANLTALKTDYAIKRSLNYKIKLQPDGRYLAVAEMTYQHQGKFDWRTTRYRTYTRVFVPLGSELVSAGEFDQGEELNKTWFGKFISLEPGQTKTLRFEYLLPKTVIKDGLYTLFVQKQLGTISPELTLDLNFGNNIVSAKPAELESDWGNDVYNYTTDLRLDRNFEISF